jgi:hypothetical protein
MLEQRMRAFLQLHPAMLIHSSHHLLGCFSDEAILLLYGLYKQVHHLVLLIKKQVSKKLFAMLVDAVKQLWDPATYQSGVGM